MEGNAIASVRPSVCPSVRLFPLYLWNRLTADLELLYSMTIACRRLKVNVMDKANAGGPTLIEGSFSSYLREKS